MNGSACSPRDPMPLTHIMDNDIPHQMTCGNHLDRAGLATHALPTIHIGFCQSCLDEKMRINYPRELLVIPKLSTEAGKVIKIST